MIYSVCSQQFPIDPNQVQDFASPPFQILPGHCIMPRCGQLGHGHRNSGFTHSKWWIFPWFFVNVYQRVLLFENLGSTPSWSDLWGNVRNITHDSFQAWHVTSETSAGIILIQVFRQECALECEFENTYFASTCAGQHQICKCVHNFGIVHVHTSLTMSSNVHIPVHTHM